MLITIDLTKKQLEELNSILDYLRLGGEQTIILDDKTADIFAEIKKKIANYLT